MGPINKSIHLDNRNAAQGSGELDFSGDNIITFRDSVEICRGLYNLEVDDKSMLAKYNLSKARSFCRGVHTKYGGVSFS